MSEKNLSLKHRLILALFGLATWPLAQLPLSWLIKIGGLLGSLGFYVLKRRRLIAVDNIIQAQQAGGFPENLNPYLLAKKSFEEQGKSIFEILKLFYKGPAKFKSLVSFKNVEYFQKAQDMAQKNGSGVMLISAHTGNWELAGLLAPMILDFPAAVVGRTQNNPAFDKLMVKLRTLTQNRQIFKHGAVRAMFETLTSGEVLILLIDQAAVAANEGRLINFLGRPAMTNIIPARLAKKTKAVVIPAFARRLGTRHEFVFYPPFDPSQTSGDTSLEDTQKMSAALEEFIRENPDQWLWGHRRWKTQ